MNLKELFDKEFLYESKKEDKKITKIIYEFDINIKKKEEDEVPPADNNQPQEPTPEVPPVDNGVASTPMPTPAPAAEPMPTPEVPPVDNGVAPTTEPVPDLSNIASASVVTEDDDENVQVNDDNNIIRKMKGEVLLEKEEIDEIQTIEDLINILSEKKNDGVNILDEFTSDILQVMANPAAQAQLKDKIGIESKIFAEILYGKKPEDSVGVRFIKRKNSEFITTSMMIDNKIINAQYKKETLDKRITDYRNDEFEEKKS